MPLSTEPEPKSDDTCPWSDELSDNLLYEVAAHLCDGEQEDRMETSDSPTTLLPLPKHKGTTKAARQKTSLDH